MEAIVIITLYTLGALDMYLELMSPLDEDPHSAHLVGFPGFSAGAAIMGLCWPLVVLVKVAVILARMALRGP